MGYFNTLSATILLKNHRFSETFPDDPEENYLPILQAFYGNVFISMNCPISAHI